MMRVYIQNPDVLHLRVFASACICIGLSKNRSCTIPNALRNDTCTYCSLQLELMAYIMQRWPDATDHVQQYALKVKSCRSTVLKRVFFRSIILTDMLVTMLCLFFSMQKTVFDKTLKIVAIHVCKSCCINVSR